MRDYFNLPNDRHAPNTDQQIFVAGSPTGALTPTDAEFRTWEKPRGVTMVHMFLCSGGGGGGGGFSAANGSTKGGGGGGASGGLSWFLIPAYLLPDKLYVLCGRGGAGGAAGSAGTSGLQSFVLISPDSTNFAASNVLLSASANGQPTGAGQPGSAAGSGAGGTAPSSTFGAGQGIWSQLGYLLSFAGLAGTAGGTGSTGTGGTNFSFPTAGNFILPGTGGGASNGAGTDGIGGTYTVAASQIGTVVESFPAAAAAGKNGSGGSLLKPPINPFVSFGGTGGGGSSAAVGGQGGSCGNCWGSGGGGGGGGTTGGAGGDGGPGAVVITCW